MADTIVALATPTGRSGIGVVRLSGDGAERMGVALAGDNASTFSPRRSQLVKLVDPANSEVIDEAIVTYFKSPSSFTGEDVVEISCHGSPVLLRRVLDICLRLGARMAEPGEFSLRALANERMNLAQAEAVRDLIDAQTVASARQAVRQMRGEFSHQLQPIKNELLDVIVLLESALEFVEDDLPETQNEAITTKLVEIVEDVDRMAGSFRAGKLIREGLSVAIVGRPNVGKSSLFNSLLGSERAIVTDIAGTTRDQIHERFTVGDIPVSLIDTAGLRETEDTVESIGVERSRRTMADADLVLVMVDASEPLIEEDLEIIGGVSEVRHLVVVNKIDKADDQQIAHIKTRVAELDEAGSRSILVSAKTGEGLRDLERAIVEPFSPQEIQSNGFLVTDARHHDLLLRAAGEIRNSIDLLDGRASEEIILIGLHNALRYLGQITGETTTEDMLTRIFSTFCIGK